MAASLNEIDVLLNRHALRKARLEKLLEQSGIHFTSDPEAERELEKQQEAELRNQISEFHGVGYDPKDKAEELKRKALTSDERLRRQLLGTGKAPGRSVAGKARNSRADGSSETGGAAPHARSRLPSPGSDAEGRAAAVTKRARTRTARPQQQEQQRLHQHRIPNTAANNDDDPADPVTDGKRPTTAAPASASSRPPSPPLPPSTVAASSGSATRKRPLLYLDELLAEKARRKAKKKRQQRRGMDGGNHDQEG